MKLLMTLLFILSPGLRAERFEIRLHRTQTVGARHEWVTTGRVTVAMTEYWEGHVSDESRETSFYRIEGVSTILEVDELGLPQKVEFLVSVFTVRDGNPDAEESDVLLEEAKLTYWFEDEDTKMQLNGKQAPEEILQHTRFFFHIPPSGITEDDFWAPGQPKRVGDVWEVNRDILAEVFAHSGFRIHKGQTESRILLRDAYERDGVPSLEFEWRITVPESKSIPRDGEDHRMRAKFREEGRTVLPQDPDVDILHHIRELSFESRMPLALPHEIFIYRVESRIEHHRRRLPEVPEANPEP